MLQQTYEAQLEEVAHKLAQTEEILQGELDTAEAYRTTLGKVLSLLKSPAEL